MPPNNNRKLYRTTIIVFSVIFLLLGLGTLGTGAWIQIDYQSFSGAFGSNVIFQYLAPILMTAGSVTALYSFAGLVGAWKLNEKLLKTFRFFIVICMMLEVALLVFAFFPRSAIQEGLAASITLYRTEPVVTSAWDTLHTWLNCCGVKSGKDFRGIQNPILSHRNPWPESCCVRQVTDSTLFVDKRSCLFNEVDVAFTNANTGCYEPLSDRVESYSHVIGGVIAGMMLLQILAFVCTKRLIANTTKSNSQHYVQDRV